MRGNHAANGTGVPLRAGALGCVGVCGVVRGCAGLGEGVREEGRLQLRGLCERPCPCSEDNTPNLNPDPPGPS